MPAPDITWKFWLRLGCTSFGGPGPQIAELESRCVEPAGWLSREQFLRALGLCMFLPGPEAQQLVAWIAWRSAGWRRAVLATVLFILPGLLACGLLAWAYVAWGSLPYVDGALRGARAAIVGIVLVAATRLVLAATTEVPRRWAAGLAFAGLLVGVPFLVIALAAGLFGWYVRPPEEEALPPVSARLKDACRLSLRRLLPVAGAFLALWAWYGHAHGIVRLSEVSLLAVLLSFGGAYAALGYWRLRADAHGWLPDPAFGNALAVGEATPGPLLLAGSFIGSVAGWQGHLGLAPGWCGGLIGLALPALFTFIPSTILVLSFAEVAEEGVGDRPMHDAIGMVAAVAAGAVLSLGVGLVFRLENLILAVPVAAIAGGLSYRRALGAPALIGLGAAAGFFFVR
jgi:chromate transporter